MAAVKENMRFYVYAINIETQAEEVLGYAEKFDGALKLAEILYDDADPDRAKFDVRCFDQGARPGAYCYWSLKRAPQCATLYARPRSGLPFTHDDLLMGFTKGEVAVL